MLNTLANIRVATPDRHVLRLAKYFEHRVSVHREDHLVRIHFPDATCEFRPTDDRLLIHIKSQSQLALARWQEVIARNLRQVTARQDLVFAWSGK